jgi:hypothetical protein
MQRSYLDRKVPVYVFASEDAYPFIVSMHNHTFCSPLDEVLFTYVMRFCSRTFLYCKDVRHEPLITYVLTPCSPTSTDCLNLFVLITAIKNGEGTTRGRRGIGEERICFWSVFQKMGYGFRHDIFPSSLAKSLKKASHICRKILRDLDTGCSYVEPDLDVLLLSG